MRSMILLISFVNVGLCAVPPETWQERWYGHTQLLTRHYNDSEVIVYFDKDVDKSATWMNPFLRDIWAHVKKTYGKFGDDPLLYVIFHKDKYPGGLPISYFEEVQWYRNVVDVGKSGDKAWTLGDADEMDHITYTVARLVLNCNNGVHKESDHPQYAVAKDKWVEIFQYDVYKALGGDDAQRVYDFLVTSAVQWPRNNTYWFRDWYYPIYEQYGGAGASNRFFVLLSRHFPKAYIDTFDRPQYIRDMNMGEFVHFWSGAAKVNLKAMASKAFGWNSTYESQFEQARQDFPEVKYYNIITL